MRSHDVTYVVPSIPPRAKLLRRLIHSITLQTLQPASVIVEIDHDHTGAAATRHRALEKVTTPFVAFADDDDILDPHHLETLRATAEEYGADYVWSRFRLKFADGRELPGPQPLGAGSFQQWNDDAP